MPKVPKLTIFQNLMNDLQGYFEYQFTSIPPLNFKKTFWPISVDVVQLPYGYRVPPSGGSLL